MIPSSNAAPMLPSPPSPSLLGVSSPSSPPVRPPSLTDLPPELVHLVLVRLKELARHPADRHWALSQVMCVNKALFHCARPLAWNAVSSCLWTDCDTGQWTCANDRGRALRRLADPLYSALIDSHPLSLLADPPPDHIAASSVHEYSLSFEVACEALSTHFHHGGSMVDFSSDSDSGDEDDCNGSHCSHTSSSSSRPGSLSPDMLGHTGEDNRDVPLSLLHSLPSTSLSSYSTQPDLPMHSAGGGNTFTPLARTARSRQPPNQRVLAQALPHSAVASLTRLVCLQRLTITSTCTFFDDSTMDSMGRAVYQGLGHCRLSYLSIDISSYPGHFLQHLVSLSTPALQYLTIRFCEKTTSQALANRAAVELVQRACNLKTLSVTAREIAVPLLAEIARCPRLGSLELRGEIVESHGKCNDELWPELTPALASSSVSRWYPGSIHTLRLFLSGGHESLVTTIFLNLKRPLQVLEWPVHLSSRVYGHLIVRTQSFLLQCPQRLASMYYDAILTDASSSPILTHMQLHGYPGRDPPPHPMVYVQSLTLIDVPPVDVAHLLASGAFPNLHALAVRLHDHQTATLAPWLLALLDRNTSRHLGLDSAAASLSPLTSVSLECALHAGPTLDRVRALAGYRAAAAVPYVARADCVSVSHLISVLAGATEGVVFPWTVSPSGTFSLDLAQAGRPVLVHVTYRERPDWANASSMAIQLVVRLTDGG